MSSPPRRWRVRKPPVAGPTAPPAARRQADHAVPGGVAAGAMDALRRTGKRLLKEYHSQMRPFENEYQVAPGVLVHRTGGHTPGHNVVRLASGGDRLTFAGDAVFQVGGVGALLGIDPAFQAARHGRYVGRPLRFAVRPQPFDRRRKRSQ